jgi:alpha-mannosidase
MTMIKRLLILVTVLLMTSSLAAETHVAIERNNGLWTFPSIPRPSRSAASHDSKIIIVGNEPEMSCLSPDGLHNGVLPWQGKQTRDFFAFSNFNAHDGKIVMDLGSAQPIAAVATYSWQDGHGGYVNGMRAPQVYSLYASAAAAPDATKLANGDWVKIADVDTRPKGRGGQHASFIHDDKGALLGNFRWLVWDVKRTLLAGEKPEWTGTWYAELDVHTPETLKHAGDAVMAGAELDEIVLSFKTHFDIGFTHPAPEIVNIYRTSMIDHALRIIDESRKLPPDQRFAWTIPSWVMYQLLWPGQDPVRRNRILAAVKEGSLVVHALPVSLQTESLDLEDLVATVGINTRVAHETGMPLSRAGKMTDVPSHSWVLPTLLKNAGIDFLHIGVNSCNERPDVPLLYNWQGPDGSLLLTMHNQGYGSDEEQGKGLYPPKDWPYKHWLAMIMTSDNQGPPDQGQLQGLLAEAKRNLPKVNIHLGRMEDFANGIFAEEKAGVKVPVVHADMPDCWIHGMGSMPQQDALAHTARMELIATESLDTHLRAWGLPRPDIREKLFVAHERSMMYGEHTWGGAQNLQGRNAYADKNFENTVQTDGICQWLQRTWNDHAAYIEKTAAITSKLSQQEMEQLAAGVNVAGDRIVVFNPLPSARDAIVEIPGHPGEHFLARDLPPSGYKTWPLQDVLASQTSAPTSADTAILENAFLKVTLDRAKGGIISIVDKKTGRELVDANAKYAFGQYLYQRFDRKQTYDYDRGCEHIDSIYGFATGWNIRADVPADVPYAEAVPSYTQMSVSKDDIVQTAKLSADAAGLIASKVTTTITLPENSPWLEIAIRLDDKKPDYWPENGEFYLPVKAEHPRFRIGRLGGIADPSKDFAPGSNRTYGYVNNGALIADADGVGVGICPLDNGIMSFGDKGIYTIDQDYVPQTPVACASLFNNLWTINFPYWCKGTIESRLRVWATHDLNPSSLIEPALDARQPVLAAVASGPAGKLPVTAGGLALSRPGVRLIQFAPNPDGVGTVLRLWEQNGEAGKVSVTFPNPCPFTQALPVNLRGETEGDPIPIEKGVFSFQLGAYAPASFVFTPELPSAALPSGETETTRLSELDLAGITQGWGTPQKDKSVAGSPLRVGGVDYKSGIGTHAVMTWILPLDKKGIEFSALVGMQDFGPADNGKGSVEFIICGDGKELFRSGILHSGDTAKSVKIDLKGINMLFIQVTNGGDGNSADHADFIDPRITHTGAPLNN